MLVLLAVFAEGCSSTRNLCEGCVYEGELVNRKPHGRGTVVWPYGDEYTGEFRSGVMHGNGTYTWNDGRVFVGSFVNDKIQGSGTLTYPNGDNYAGEFVNEFWHGRGTFTFANGDTETGHWQNDKLISGIVIKSKTETGAPGKEWIEAGMVEQFYSGDMKNGKSHGRGSLVKYDRNTGKMMEKFSGRWEEDVFRSGVHEKYHLETQTVVFRFNGELRADGSYQQGQIELYDESGSPLALQSIPAQDIR